MSQLSFSNDKMTEAVMRTATASAKIKEKLDEIISSTRTLMKTNEGGVFDTLEPFVKQIEAANEAANKILKSMDNTIASRLEISKASFTSAQQAEVIASLEKGISTATSTMGNIKGK